MAARNAHIESNMIKCIGLDEELSRNHIDDDAHLIMLLFSSQCHNAREAERLLSHHTKKVVENEVMNEN